MHSTANVPLRMYLIECISSMCRHATLPNESHQLHPGAFGAADGGTGGGIVGAYMGVSAWMSKK